MIKPLSMGRDMGAHLRVTTKIPSQARVLRLLEKKKAKKKAKRK